MAYGGPALYKRGGKWWARINGKRVSTKQSSRKLAEITAIEMAKRAADPAYRASTATGLGDALRRWLDDRRVAGRSDATISYYRTKAGALVGVLGVDTPLAGLTREALRGYVARREAEGAAPHTVHKELGALRSCLRWARAEGLYSGDPAAVLPSGYSPRYEPRRTYLTPEQVWVLVHDLDPDRGAHVAWLAGTACRWGESKRAMPGDADLIGRTARVRGTKTKRARQTDRIPILAPALPLVAWAVERAPRSTASGGMFSRWPNVLRDLRRACERAGLPRVTPNDLRRCLPSWCRQAGAPLDLVADVLRHVDTRMVREVYGVSEPEATGAALDRFFAPAAVPNLYRRRQNLWRRWRRWRARRQLKQAALWWADGDSNPGPTD